MLRPSTQELSVSNLDVPTARVGMGQEYSVGHNTDMDLSDLRQPDLRSVTRGSPGRWGTFTICGGKYCSLVTQTLLRRVLYR